MPSSRLY